MNILLKNQYGWRGLVNVKGYDVSIEEQGSVDALMVVRVLISPHNSTSMFEHQMICCKDVSREQIIEELDGLLQHFAGYKNDLIETLGTL